MTWILLDKLLLYYTDLYPTELNHTHTQQTHACSVLHPPSHAGHWNTLEESCCRTCRRLRAKYGRRPQAVDRRNQQLANPNSLSDEM